MSYSNIISKLTTIQETQTRQAISYFNSLIKIFTKELFFKSKKQKSCIICSFFWLKY